MIMSVPVLAIWNVRKKWLSLFIEEKRSGHLVHIRRKKYGDNSTFSAYGVFSNVLKGEPETGNCLGTSQVCAYLLMSRGIDVRLLKKDSHGLLEVKINEKWFPIETTTENGFDYVSKAKFKSYNISGLELEILGYQALVLSRKEKYDLAIEKNMKAIKLNKENSRLYKNRAISLFNEKEFGLAIKDAKKYASFGEENALRVEPFIKESRRLLELGKNKKD